MADTGQFFGILKRAGFTQNGANALKSSPVIGYRFGFHDFNHLALSVACLMDEPALGFADLLHQTGRQHRFCGHIKKPVFNRGGPRVYNEYFHWHILCIADFGLRIVSNFSILT
jgi:hypothetical protein